MPKEDQKDKVPSSDRLFSCQDEGAVTYLRFIAQDGLPDANPRGTMGELWTKLEEVFARHQRVLVLEHPPGMVGSHSMARFWEKIGKLSPEYQKCGWGWFPVSPRALALQREENAFRRFIEAITHADTFVVSVLQGEVMLPFLGLALACDYRLVTDETVFLNHCLVGEFPAVGALPWFLVRHLGYGKALHLLMNRERIAAAEALQLALVDRVVGSADLDGEVRACAEQFARIPGRELATMKRLVATAGDSLSTYLSMEGEIFGQWLDSQSGDALAPARLPGEG